MNISRRQFIKGSAAAATAAAIGVSVPIKSYAEDVVDKWVKGVCRFCGTGCGVYLALKMER